VVCLGGIAAVVLFLVHVSQDVKGVGVAVNGTLEVVVGETFELSVTVTNEPPRRAVVLSDVDVAEDCLAGFTVSTIEPRPKSSMHVPIDNSRSFTFDVQIPPGSSRPFTFTLRAERSDPYRGDVDVCGGPRFISSMAETSVKEKKSEARLRTRSGTERRGAQSAARSRPSIAGARLVIDQVSETVRRWEELRRESVALAPLRPRSWPG
jgi:hypothetical protein